ncbi:transcriptional regulator [Bradyrhizobium oligotrophicum S58]|uniref:Transcriptional regulator n=1 Tax=Bradyrhizobium oligotrophicum S58 TaxID=1245469 RepID=M4Z2W9_9BRAD|nr:winged helix-turn-helix domain-containing protein [Bradyrhizobium oligotrophicum]BAM87434.1 transcriptional regulator [Bradyrhizobium oligotrophicum S58]
MPPPAQRQDTISFGPFELIVNERRLTRHGVRMELGARAFEILVTLLSRPNEIIDKAELIAKVWPGIAVEEGSLRFHVAALRKVLDDGKDGARYISTTPGRGYSFVAAISRTPRPVRNQPHLLSDGSPAFAHYNLPNRLSAMIDREDDLERLSNQLYARRFVTIVGSGGIGKTTVAVAAAHQLRTAFDGAVLFVDLSMLSDPGLVATGVASTLGLSVQSQDVMSSLISHLRDKSLLLVLDTCEHLIAAVAVLAAAIFNNAPRVHILATSRETLQVEGEHVYRLDPLAFPVDDRELLSADTVRTFPATQLFVERATASGANLAFDDSDAAIIARICRKLDGVALAIELAARRVDVYGLNETEALLDQRLSQMWAGPRTAPPRQRTLQATLDWSYGLLSETERMVLRRLAIFVGNFTLDAALAVVAGDGLDQADVFAAIDSLVAKSMVATRSLGTVMRYRLLDTTRTYALDRAADERETAALAVRHARYCRDWLKRAGSEWSSLMSGTERAPYFAAISNVRAALEWCFGASGDLRTGVELAAAAVPVLLAMSLLPECHHWSERALAAGQATSRTEQMHLQAGLGISSMHLYGENERARAALNSSLEIAREEHDAPNEAGLLGMLHMFHFRGGDFDVALSFARRCRTVADNVDDPAALALAHSILGRSLLMMGDLSGARGELEELFRTWSPSLQSRTIYLVHDRHYRAGIALARTLWLQGYPAQAVQRVHEFVDGARQMDHPASVTVLLAWSASIFLWTGDLRNAERHIDASITMAESNSLGPLAAVGRARRAQLAIRQGNVAEGVASLRASLAAIHAVRYELITTEFNISLAQGLAATGRPDAAIAHLDETIRHVGRNGDTCYMPELLRVKAGLLLSMVPLRIEAGQACLEESLALSRSQGARGWELRAAHDLAVVLAGKGQRRAAHQTLRPVFDRFDEGFDTADLLAAKRLLADLS